MGKRDDDAWRRFREREDEAEAEEQNLSLRQRRAGVPPAPEAPSASTGAQEGKFDELIERAIPLMEQLNNLYNMYMAGIEKLPPTERRKHLDQVIQTLVLMPKPQATRQFKFQTIFNQYQSYKERWDKLLRDLESGKIKRRGPNK